MVAFASGDCPTKQEKLKRAFLWGRRLADYLTRTFNNPFLSVALSHVYLPFLLYPSCPTMYAGFRYTSLNCTPEFHSIGGSTDSRALCPDLRELLVDLAIDLLSLSSSSPSSQWKGEATAITDRVRKRLIEMVQGKVPAEQMVRTIELNKDIAEYKSSDGPVHAALATMSETEKSLLRQRSRISFIHIVPQKQGKSAQSAVQKKRRDCHTASLATVCEKSLAVDFAYYLEHHYLSPLTHALSPLRLPSVDRVFCDARKIVQRLQHRQPSLSTLWAQT